MRIEVATGALAEVRDAVRRAAVQLRDVGTSLTWPTDSGDLAADDAVRLLGDVLAESLEQLERVLQTVSVVVDVAAADYARAEARASVEVGGR